MFELERASNVVDMRVGDEDLLELESEFHETVMDAGDIVAWIDHDGFACLFIAEDGAVALKGTDGKGFENHLRLRL
jgi:hypothetical protein